MRNKFDCQLERLSEEMFNMSSLIEAAIDLSVTSLINNDKDSAYKTKEYEEKINEKEREIENLCMKLLLQQQPVAKDLRIISSALKMITDMERIGDQAEDIAELTLEIDGNADLRQIKHIPQMAKETAKMVSNSIFAFVEHDIDVAKSVIKSDDLVDDLFLSVKCDLIKLINQDVSCGETAIDLLMIAKYFERIGDHAVNVAEWVIYSITGVHKDGQSKI